jgi:hypothetical protein
MSATHESVSALRKRHREKERETQSALKAAYEQLKREKPSKPWTKAELCRLAGLKSYNALINPRHANFIALFDAHNNDVKSARKRGPVSLPPETDAQDTIRRLRKNLAELKKQFDQACSLNGAYQREALHYKQEYEDLLLLKSRIETERGEWKKKFFAAHSSLPT